MLVRLQTADYRRLSSPVQEQQGATAAVDRTRILRFPLGEQDDPRCPGLCAPSAGDCFCALGSPGRGLGQRRRRRRVRDRPELGRAPPESPLLPTGLSCAEEYMGRELSRIYTMDHGWKPTPERQVQGALAEAHACIRGKTGTLSDAYAYKAPGPRPRALPPLFSWRRRVSETYGRFRRHVFGGTQLCIR